MAGIKLILSVFGLALLPGLNEGHNLPTPEMIKADGYPAEIHVVKTDDCFILEMHRIPPQGPGPNPVVYLQHCLLCSSADYLIQGPGKSIGYLLADLGYDVWLGNYRGNTYSRNHCHLDPDEQEFWKHSWDHMAQYDLPAQINYVLDYTQAEKIFYIGHSMGTTGFMAMERYHPELYDRIALASLMAPIAYVSHMESPIKYLAPFDDTVEFWLDLIGLGEFLPSQGLMDWLAKNLCDEDDLPEICASVIYLLCGFDMAQTNVTNLETIIAHTPAGASTHTVIQYGQEVGSGKFCSYDHGKRKNKEIYGQEEPPEYYPENVSAPVAAYWGDNDWLAHPIDLTRLLGKLPNLVHNYEVPFKKWNHMDFLHGIDAKTLVYEDLVEQMELVRRKMEAQ